MNDDSNLYHAIKQDRASGLLEHILLHPLDYSGWSLQGFGMLRLYLTKEIRLHIWHKDFAVPGVSQIHDHPWDFKSYILCGSINNKRYQVGLGKTHLCSTIKCGAGGGMRSEPHLCSLNLVADEVWGAGQTYHQRAEEIHLSEPEDGTVSIVERHFRPDAEHARVFWRNPGDWVSAEPRPAVEHEILAITAKAREVYQDVVPDKLERPNKPLPQYAEPVGPPCDDENCCPSHGDPYGTLNYGV